MKVPVFDGHCDTPMELWMQAQPLRSNTLAVSLERGQRLGGWAQFFAFCTAWVAAKLPRPEIFARALDNFEGQLRENEDRIALCRTDAEAETAMRLGKCAAFLSIEGAEAVREDEGLLELAYARGVRMVSLVWNLPNGLAGSCQTGEGLTAKGKSFFRRAQKLGMIVDVSHLSERAFWDMTELAEKPIVASHSNSFAVCPHPRNLTDDQFRAIRDLGGTAGLNLYGPFLTEHSRATFDDVQWHLDHFLSLGGESHIALGADLDGCEVLPEGFSGVDDYNRLGEFLKNTGYSDETIQNLFFQSLMGVMQSCTT